MLKVAQGIDENTVLNLRERAWNGGQYEILGKIIPDSTVVDGILGEVDLKGTAQKTITVVNVGGQPLGAGSIIFAGPAKGKVIEQISTADFDALAAGGVVSFSLTQANRFWDLRLVGGASGNTKVDVYVDVNIHG